MHPPVQCGFDRAVGERPGTSRAHPAPPTNTIAAGAAATTPPTGIVHLGWSLWDLFMGGTHCRHRRTPSPPAPRPPHHHHRHPPRTPELQRPRARYPSISVHESRCDADGNSRMVREPLVHRNNIPGKPRVSRRRNSTTMVRPRYRANDAGVVRNVFLHCTFGWRIPKLPPAFARDPPPGITNAYLHSVMPSPTSEGCSGARRVFQCLSIPRTMWKFQPS